MKTVTHSGDWPLNTRPSQPARFIISEKKLPDSESPIMPVSGDLAATPCLVPTGMVVPANALHAKHNAFSGPNGSQPAGVLS